MLGEQTVNQSDSRRSARARILDRYGTARSAIGRTVYTWFNLSLFLAFAYPVLIIFFQAPNSRPENTPNDWFVLRLGTVVIAFVLTAWFWRLNDAPTAAAGRDGLITLLRRGGIWLQVTIFLIGISFGPAAILLFSNPGPGAKALSLGLFEVLAIQCLIPGMVKAMTDTLYESPRLTLWLCIGLFAGTFAIQSAIGAGIQSNSTNMSIVQAFGAGALVGTFFGWIFMTLREKTGSIWPGILAHWLLIGILPVYVDG